MKRILVTGAAGTIGLEVIKFLLSEGKYEISILDLKNGRVHKLFKKYKNRVNIVYGDICDRILMENLVKDHDAIIHLAGVLPPLGMIQKDLSRVIEHNAIENIARSINYYNPKCEFIYSSSTTVYGPDKNDITIKSGLYNQINDYYAFYKRSAEKLIKEKLKHYVIVRTPLILTENKNENLIYNVNKNAVVSTITKDDAGYAFIRVLDKSKELNKKTINIGGSDDFNMSYSDLLKKIIPLRGLSYKHILNDLFIEKNYNSPVCSDTPKFNELIDYQRDSFENYLNRVRYTNRKRYISKFFGKLYLKIRGIK